MCLDKCSAFALVGYVAAKCAAGIGAGASAGPALLFNFGFNRLCLLSLGIGNKPVINGKFIALSLM